MALTRGVSSLFPCPCCLIPKEEQGESSGCTAARTSADVQETIEDTRKQKAGEKEEILKSQGLRDINIRNLSHSLSTLTQIIPTEHVLEDCKLRPV